MLTIYELSGTFVVEKDGRYVMVNLTIEIPIYRDDRYVYFDRKVTDEELYNYLDSIGYS